MKMKCSLLVFVCALAALKAVGQGSVNFNNNTTGISAPIRGYEPGNPTLSITGDASTDTPSGSQTYTGSRLAGSGYHAQIFYSPLANQQESSLTALGVPTVFRSGGSAGFVVPVTNSLGVASGTTVTIQIRAWDSSGGSDWASAQTAWMNGTISAGKSQIFNLVAASSPPATLSGLPLSFNIYYIISPAPAITNQPASQTIAAGQNATFTVGTTGLSPLTYQWNFNGSAIPGATNGSYMVQSAQITNVGSYNVAVSNSFGSVTSSAALLMLAGTAVWTNPASGKWENASNWIGGTLPGSTQSVFIVNAGSKTVSIDATTAGSFSNTMTVSNLTLANAAAATWTAVTTNGAPAGRINHTAVWSGTEMLIWGGTDAAGFGLNDGGRFNPQSNVWSSIPTSTIRQQHSAVWTGNEMIIWGGFGGPHNNTYLNDGARYNPSLGTWTATTNLGAPSPRWHHTAVWTGTEMIVWGGGSNNTYYSDGARYNPASDAWTTLPTNGAPAARYLFTAVWTGSEMIIWGGEVFSGNPSAGARYNPASNSWTALQITGAPSPRAGHAAVWTGREMIVWGGGSGFGPNGYDSDGGRYNPALDSWISIPTNGAPSPREFPTAVWTGNGMLVWGGLYSSGSPQYFNDGGGYSPDTAAWLATTTNGAPGARDSHTATWTGTDMIVWGGISSLPYYFGDGGQYSGGAANVVDLTAGSTNPPLHLLNNLSLQMGGSMLVESNSTLQADGQTSIGDVGFPSTSGIGTLAVNSGSATLANAFIGNTTNANGAVGINGGALLISNNLTLGDQFSSTGIVSMTAGRLITTNGALTIGSNGVGIFNQFGGTNQASIITLGAGASSVGSYTVTNAALNAKTLNLGSAVGGPGNMTIQSNATTTVSSNISVVSGSLLSTSSISISGGSLIATNGLMQVGSTGSGAFIVSGGTHAIRQLKLGAPNGSGSGFFHLTGGYFKVLGTGSGPGAGLDCNYALIDGGEYDSSGSSITIGDGHDADAAMLGNGQILLANMYVGYSAGFTGTYTQSMGTLVLSGNMIVGDDCVHGTGGAIGRVMLSNSALYITNAAHNAVLDIRNGTFILGPNATLVVDNLIATNACGLFLNYGGQLTTTQSPLFQTGMIPLLSGTSFLLGFSATNNTTYYIDQATNLAAPIQWTNFITVTGNGTFLQVPVPVMPMSNAPPRFFRLWHR
jgi:hypothetical protein